MQELLLELNRRGVRLTLEGERLGISAPKGSLDEPLRERLKQHKDALLALLRSEAEREEAAAGEVHVEPDERCRHEPFPLTEAQHAYWMGRNELIELGGVATHLYLEFEQTGLGVDRLQAALRRVIDRHDMLRAVIGADGLQRILPQAPPYCIEVTDLSALGDAERQAQLLALREHMLHTQLPIDACPLLEVRAARLGGGALRLCIKLDMLIIDASSLYLFFEDWRRFYETPGWQPAPLQLSYRDYAQFEHGLPHQPAFERAKAYWQRRLDELPAAPDLPLAVQPAQLKQRTVLRRDATLSAPRWQALKDHAKRHGATPSVVLMCAFSDVLRMWSREPDFTLNLTMFNRYPVHPEVNHLIGDFTTTSLLVVQPPAGASSFAERLKHLQQRLAEDMAHREFSGMRVLRERARRLRSAPNAAMPVVFTSSIALASQQSTTDSLEFLGEYVYGSSQTPQVWLDHLMEESKGELMYCWDAVDALFPAGLLDDMFAAYGELLHRLADDAQAWGEPGRLVPLPAWQQALMQAANATRADIAETTLHALFEQQAQRTPDAPAVICARGTTTYRELRQHAARLAHWLQGQGVRPGTLVAVSMEKGWEQVAAVLGMLYSGAAYLPIEPGLPEERRRHLLQRGEATVVVTQAHLRASLGWPGDANVVTLHDEALSHQPDTPPPPRATPADLAYVIFTSGSTGEPKGVMIDHRAAANTVQDIDARFALSAQDRVLALSALNFDLSVWDIFGPLAAGGAVVMPEPARATDPAHWSELIAQHGITVWNSVPQLLQIWSDHLHDSRAAPVEGLRLAMLSGDWIPVGLPGQIRARCPSLQLHSLGGATEASIWSISYPIGQVDPAWKSIPYGKALANQTMHVLDRALQPCPVWAVGHIYIGGVGVARGYWRDEARTVERFITHPGTGERLYHTGDLGRLLPDGNIEFLGRDDFQVKLNGYRIELGEIAAHLRRLPGVQEAVVNVAADARGGGRQLVAYLVVSDAERAGWRERIAGGEVTRELGRALPDYMVPRHCVLLDQLPLTPNGKVDASALPAPWGDGGPTAERGQPRTVDEQTLFDLWCEVLGHGEFGVQTSFFEAGGDSLTAIRVAGLVRERFKLADEAQQKLMQQLFREPSIEALARFVETMRAGNAMDEIATEGTELDFRQLEAEIPVLPDLRLANLRPSPEVSRTILLTGATGFLGSHLLAQLLASTDCNVVALARGTDDADAERRVRDALEAAWGGASGADRLRVVRADLSQPRLGLDGKQWNQLAAMVDEVVHCGAYVNYVMNREALWAANVGGTREVIELCCTTRHKRLHFISSLAATAIERMLREERSDELPKSGVGFGYGFTKYAADRLVLQAAHQGLHAVTYRLDDVMPSTLTGVSGEGSVFEVFMKFCAREGIALLGGGGIGLLCVDRLARWLVSFVGSAGRQHRAGQVLDVTATSVVPLEELLGLVERNSSRTFTRLDYRQFFGYLAVCNSTDAAVLRSLLPEPADGDEAAGVFDRAIRLMKALGEAGRRLPSDELLSVELHDLDVYARRCSGSDPVPAQFGARRLK